MRPFLLVSIPFVRLLSYQMLSRHKSNVLNKLPGRTCKDKSIFEKLRRGVGKQATACGRIFTTEEVRQARAGVVWQQSNLIQAIV